MRYDVAVWRERMRPAQLAREPTCRYCRARGLLVEGTEVDHVVPHRGDPDLFFDDDNLQSLCCSCHAAKSQHERFSDDPYLPPGCTLDGTPIHEVLANDTPTSP